MNSFPARFCSKSIFLVLVVSVLVASAAAQNVLATVPIPTASAGQVAINPALNRIYAGGGPNSGGSSLTVIDASTFAVIGTTSGAAGVSVDMKQDNYWTGSLSAGNINIFAGASGTNIGTVSVGSCPASVTYDCAHRRMWAASSCGSGNDPVWLLNADTLSLVGSAIPSGGTISQPAIVSPFTGKLYMTAGGISEEVNPSTFAVTATPFGGTVMAIDSFTNKIFAVSGTNLQVVQAKSEAVAKTIAVGYTPAGVGVNNAMAHIYTTNPTGNSIDVYSENGKKIATFALGSGNQPTSLAVDSVRGRLFVDVFNSGSNSWSLQVIEDLSTVRHCGFQGSCDY